MVDAQKADERKALATVSSLKRALGVPNHPTKKDAFVEKHCHIYTPDEESAILLGELLYRYGNGPREKFYNAHPEKITIRDTVQVRALEEGFAVSMNIPWPKTFVTFLEKMINKQIAPDHSLRR